MAMLNNQRVTIQQQYDSHWKENRLEFMVSSSISLQQEKMGIKHGYLTSEALSNKAVALLDWETPTSVEGAGAPKVQAAALPTFSHKVTKAVHGTSRSHPRHLQWAKCGWPLGRFSQLTSSRQGKEWWLDRIQTVLRQTKAVTLAAASPSNEAVGLSGLVDLSSTFILVNFSTSPDPPALKCVQPSTSPNFSHFQPLGHQL